MSDIKQLINNIIEDTPNNGYDSTCVQDRGMPVFDKRECKNKLSMLVLKDIIHGMMRDEPIDGLDNMVSTSIDRYLNDPAFKNSGAFEYICRSRDRLHSPMLGDLIQELEETTEQISAQVKNGETINVDDYDVNDILKNVENYDDLRKTLKDIVSKKVVNDVTRTIIRSNDTPTFGDLDEKLAKTTDDEIQESVIMTMSSKIFSESYRHDKNADLDTATQMAMVEFCVYQMSQLFKQYPRVDIYKEYDIKPTQNQLYKEASTVNEDNKYRCDICGSLFPKNKIYESRKLSGSTEISAGLYQRNTWDVCKECGKKSNKK